MDTVIHRYLLKDSMGLLAQLLIPLVGPEPVDEEVCVIASDRINPAQSHNLLLSTLSNTVQDRKGMLPEVLAVMTPQKQREHNKDARKMILVILSIL